MSHLGSPGRYKGNIYNLPTEIYDPVQAFLPDSSVTWFDEKIEVEPGDSNVPFTVVFANVGTQDITGIRGQLSLPLGFSGINGPGSVILSDSESNSLAGNNFYLTLKVLYQEVKDAVQQEGIEISTALRVITQNPAAILKLQQKGKVEAGKDADLVLLNKADLSIQSVMALGKMMVENGRPVVKGTFED